MPLQICCWSFIHSVNGNPALWLNDFTLAKDLLFPSFIFPHWQKLFLIFQYEVMNNIKGKHKTAPIKCYYVIPANPILEESTHKLQHQLAVWCFLYSLSYFQTGLSPSQRTHKSRAAPPEPRHREGEAGALWAAQPWVTRSGRCAWARCGAGLGRWRQQWARVQGLQLPKCY